MTQIWKFPIEPEPGPPGADYAVCEIVMPFSPKILKVDVQGKQPVIWAQVSPGHANKRYGFYIVPTGATMPPERYLGLYVGTWQLDNLVWHLFRSES